MALIQKQISRSEALKSTVLMGNYFHMQTTKL